MNLRIELFIEAFQELLLDHNGLTRSSRSCATALLEYVTLTP